MSAHDVLRCRFSEVPMKKTLWTKFEKVAAAMRHLEGEGSLVKWNARINQQKFDAAIRRTYNGIDFLIVMDCIDFTSPIKAATVKAFARKVDAASAHFGLLVSSSEYLDDAFKLTAEYPVYFLDSAKMHQISEEELADTVRPSPLVDTFRFILLHGSTVHISEDPRGLKSVLPNLILRAG